MCGGGGVVQCLFDIFKEFFFPFLFLRFQKQKTKDAFIWRFGILYMYGVGVLMEAFEEFEFRLLCSSYHTAWMQWFPVGRKLGKSFVLNFAPFPSSSHIQRTYTIRSQDVFMIVFVFFLLVCRQHCLFGCVFTFVSRTYTHSFSFA